MSLNVIISEVCRDPFLFVLINAYDLKVSQKKKNYNSDNYDNKRGFFTIWAKI